MNKKTPERVTNDPKSNEQLLYFTTSSLTSDDKTLFFLSDRDGYSNVYIQELSTGKRKKLTHNTEGNLKSYVYFDGTPYKGLGKASITVHEESGSLFYLQGRKIQKIKPSGEITTLAKYPKDQMTAFTHVSKDGKKLCVPTTDAEALDGNKRLRGKPKYGIDKRVQKRNLSSYLRIYDTENGEEVITEKVPRAWITHVSFSPKDSNNILYNHEWPADCGIRRMWLFNGKKHIRLREEGGIKSARDWTCHEMWERDGSAIIYHGGYKSFTEILKNFGERKYIGRVIPDTGKHIEIKFPRRFKKYGHFTVGSTSTLVTDGYYEEKHQHSSKGEWITRLDVDWKRKKITWTPLCKHRSSWATQDEHPHPIFDHGEKYIYFTSDFEGKRAVYRIGAH